MNPKPQGLVIVGVDSGQTSLRCLISTIEGRCLAYTEAQSNREVQNRLDREARLVDTIRSTLNLAGIAPNLVAAAWISMTGVPNRHSKPAALWKRAVAQAFPSAYVGVDSDILAALYGATQVGPGVVALSGTGSIALGRNADGNMARAGGWGYLIGDEGSGFHIGLSAIRAMTRAEDRMGPVTSLTKLIADELDLEIPYDIKDRLYSQRPSPRSIAALARLVAIAADNGDPVAVEILSEAGRHLASLVYPVLHRLDLIDTPTNVYPVGGILEHNTIVRQRFREELLRLAPYAALAVPKLPPVAGSLILAREALGYSAGSGFLQQLSASLPSVPTVRSGIRKAWDLDSIKAHIRGRLIVSSQATVPDRTDDPYVLTCLARSALAGGAVAVRANGPDVIRQMREAFSEPILGINKIGREVNEVYITPTFSAARDIIEAGADFIAVDATRRPRPDGHSTEELIREIRSCYSTPIVADVSTVDEAIAAEKMGAAFIATTLAGYTSYSLGSSSVSLELIRKVSSSVRIPVLAEGRILHPEEAVKCIQAGAWAVVVGSAITRPRLIAKRFAEALAGIEQDP